jgi:cyclic pyranopterin phosphate synthase
MPSVLKPGGGFEENSRPERRRSVHFGRMGRPRMNDITNQPIAPHRAVAESEVVVSQETLSAIIDGTNPKGDVLSVAELAGVMAGKKAGELVPLVHAVALTELLVSAVPDRAAGSVRIRVETATVGQGGVEMEALTAASVAALTVYDMVRDFEPGALIRSVRLVSSSGGAAEGWQRSTDGPEGPRAPRGARMAGRIGSRPMPHRRTP